MNEQQLREVIRSVVARHVQQPVPAESARPVVERSDSCADHPSHAMYLTIVNVGEACVIEPGVPCNHCGYCKSYGH